MSAGSAGVPSPRACAFPQSLSLSNHWCVHKGEQPYACGQCKKAFCQIKFLTHHERLHTGEKSFVCGDCGRAFMQSTFLALHPKTHIREKPYKCNKCSKAYIQMSHLTEARIQSLARVNTREWPFGCSVYDKAFSCSTHLVQHQHIHTLCQALPMRHVSENLPRRRWPWFCIRRSTGEAL